MSGYKGPFTIGRQPCHDFQATRGAIEDCPNCNLKRAQCLGCGSEHHFAGFETCLIRIREANVKADYFVEGLIR